MPVLQLSGSSGVRYALRRAWAWPVVGAGVLLVCAGCASGPAPRPDEPEPFVNSLGMRMVYIPPGRFMMGRGADEKDETHWRIIHEPQRPAVVGRGFFMASREVSNAQFRRFRPEHESSGYPAQPAAKYNADDLPVLRVSWDDAVAFCRWLSRREGRRYRLPTETEWEYACRAGTTTQYWWGSEPDRTGRVCNVSDLAYQRRYPPSAENLRMAAMGGGRWEDNYMAMDDGYVESAPVGSYEPNPFGLHDMIGNVWEWCEDRFRFTYDRIPKRRTPWYLVFSDWRVARGGSYMVSPDMVTCSSRVGSQRRLAMRPDDGLAIGFRVVSDFVPPELAPRASATQSGPSD